MRTRRRFGQHFLFDPAILGRIADALAPAGEDLVIEIGPGPGGLTEALLRRTSRLIAIEKDRDLVAPLRERFPGATIVEGDALAVDWHQLATEAGANRWLVTGNIPYNITSPLLERALTPPLPDRVVFLVQREVAERVAAAPGTRAYGALTVGVRAVASAERLFTVPAGAFHPPPKVDSAVLRLIPLADPLIAPEEQGSFRRMVVGLFGFRRKQLRRALRELIGLTAPEAEALLTAVGLDVAARPEVLTPQEFARLHRVLVDSGWRPE